MKSYLQYLVILLDDTSLAYCHAQNPLSERNLIPLDTLKDAVLFGMKQNLMIQYVYPNYDLPEEYLEVIESIDHVKIGKDIKVLERIPNIDEACKNLVLRLRMQEFIDGRQEVANLLSKVDRLNVCYTDIDLFSDEKIEVYKDALSKFVDALVDLYESGKQPQINILADRLQVSEMHNCGAGISNITLAPNGKFYLCPAFYYDEKMGISNRMNHVTHDATRSVGDLSIGIQIPNKHLLQLDHAPLCRICDAYQCNRCIWLNQKMTWDNNTPSHQQCVVAHIERNASMELSRKLKAKGYQVKLIEEITYLDPFDVKKEF